MESVLHVSHSNVLAEGRRGNTRGYGTWEVLANERAHTQEVEPGKAMQLTDLFTVWTEDLCSFCKHRSETVLREEVMRPTPGGSTLDDEANTSSRRTFLQLFPDGLSPDESAVLLPIFTNDPRETRFDRGRGFVQVVTIKTHSSFQTQAVSRSQASQLNRTFREQFRDFHGLRRRDRDLEHRSAFFPSNRKKPFPDLKAVLASIASPCNVEVEALNRDESRLAESQLFEVV